jgi:carbonic anhydrase/acetyltransferase-like protein (isoleucine patch superfamily)
MSVIAFAGKRPIIDASVFLAPGAVVVGDVEIGADASVWFGCVIRGDVNFVRIGARTNVQDATIIHVSRGTHPSVIGAGVTIGHGAIIHGCTIEDGAMIGIGARVLDGARVESGAIVAAGALVPPGKTVKAGEVWAGCPARYLRSVSEAERAFIRDNAPHYARLAARYRDGDGGA